jgi:isoquinoline 1-oxidoreductase beta subunit
MTKTTRRAFLAGSAAALTVPIALPALGEMSQPLEGLSDAFLRIDRDGTITCILPTCEMGQGTHTGQSAILAEELGADWEAIRIEMPKQPADPYRLPFGQMR